MKVFISWSGELSHRVAIVLRDWLPSVIQSLEPYVSSEDIDKGTRWSTDISKELEDSSYGVLCITKDNLDAPWLNFEAGALSKSVDKSRVSPFLFRVKRSEIRGPILQFQSTTFDKDDVKKLIHSLNSANDSPMLDETRVDPIFDVWWPKLEENLNEIKISETEVEKVVSNAKGPDPSSEILEEVLELLRSQHRLLNSPGELVPRGYLESVLNTQGGIPHDHPVFRDIENARREFDVVLSSFDEEDFMPTAVIKDLWSKLSSPLEFMLRRNRSRRHRTLFEDSRND